MKSDFVSNVTHELRTPLASIRVFAEFLKLGRVQSPEQVREYGDYIENETQRLTRLIDNILDFARIESGRKTYRFVDTELRVVVEPVVHSFAVRLAHDGFKLEFVPPETPLPSVAIDRDAIGQALHNLLDNALKFSGDARTIRVTLGREADELVLAVQDHGIGIASTEQRKIFERFHRAGSTLVHDVKGAGLGLSIVQHIVRAHRGRVTVESEPQHGSTFRIYLPVTGTATPAATAPGRPAPTRRTTEEPA
jgi:signal transduction histidine kinase